MGAAESPPPPTPTPLVFPTISSKLDKDNDANIGVFSLNVIAEMMSFYRELSKSWVIKLVVRLLRSKL